MYQNVVYFAILKSFFTNRNENNSSMRIKHNCTENCNIIEISSNDGVFDELSFGTSSDGMVVIGMNDLKSALAKCGLQIVKIQKFTLRK